MRNNVPAQHNTSYMICDTRTFYHWQQCGDPGGDVGAKIAPGVFRPWRIFTRIRLGDSADGEWMFIATGNTCGRQSHVDPAEVLTRSGCSAWGVGAWLICGLRAAEYFSASVRCSCSVSCSRSRMGRRR